MERTLEQVVRDQENQAKTITEIIQNQRTMNDTLFEIEKENAVRVEADKNRDEKLDSIFKLGWAVLLAVVTLFIGAVFAALRTGVFNV